MQIGNTFTGLEIYAV